MIRLEGQMWVEAFIVSLKGGWSHDTRVLMDPGECRVGGSSGGRIRLASVSSVSNSIRLVETLSVLGSPCLICETLPIYKRDC